jgi:hypothetical protein
MDNVGLVVEDLDAAITCTRLRPLSAELVGEAEVHLVIRQRSGDREGLECVTCRCR